jgi:uncharacterized membrane protein
MNKSHFLLIFKIIFSLLFILGGIAHFTKTGFYLAMMPNYLPFHLELVYISGVIEFILGITLLIPKLSRFAGTGLVLVLLAVFPANLNMYLNADQFPDMSETSLLIRLPIQLALLLWAYTYARKPR